MIIMFSLIAGIVIIGSTITAVVLTIILSFVLGFQVWIFYKRSIATFVSIPFLLFTVAIIWHRSA